MGIVPRLLMAVVLVLARMLGSAMAMPAPDMAGPVAWSELQTICHAGGGDGAAKPGAPEPLPAHGDACLLCPACHLAAHVLFPVPDGPVLPAPALDPAQPHAPVPPATGPPARPRLATPPTGPPALSV